MHIFQIIGIIYIAIALGLMINPSFYKKMISEMAQSSTILYLGGILALVVGYLLVTFYSVWAWEWSLIITIIGWMSLIKGLWMLIHPKSFVKIAKSMINTNVMVVGIVAIVIGLLCAQLGFIIL